MKPDLREQIGVAVNSSSLTFRENVETGLERVAALGAAAHAVSVGTDLEHVPIAASRWRVYGERPDVRDTISGELGPMLWHIRFGGQHGLVPAATHLYARWLQRRRLFEAFTEPAHFLVLELFAARVLHEWLSDRCLACGGSGKLERTRSGNWIRPRGSMQRDAVFGVCRSCSGTGRARPSHGDRARWLNIPLSWYESERWPQRFNAAVHWLGLFHAGRLVRPLTAQLERRRKRR